MYFQILTTRVSTPLAMQALREDPEFKQMFEEIQKGGMGAMMKYMNDPKVSPGALQKSFCRLVVLNTVTNDVRQPGRPPANSYIAHERLQGSKWGSSAVSMQLPAASAPSCVGVHDMPTQLHKPMLQ